MIINSKLTVYFEDPFWVGVFEIKDEKIYMAAKVTFGEEPKDIEVYNFLLKNYFKLKFIEIKEEKDVETNKRKNPKRIQRKIRQEISNKGIGTKAQNALKKQHEENKIERKRKSKEQRELEEEIKYKKKQEKRKEKHKGH